MSIKVVSYWHSILMLLITSILLLTSCYKREQTIAASPTPLIVTTVAPYKFLLQELAGPYIEVLNTSEQSADPHIVDLTPQQTIQLQMADLFLSLNPLEERLILQSLGSQTRVAQMWHGFPLLAAPEGHSHEGQEEHQETEEKEGWDEHFWLSPVTLPVQIATMARELEALIPAQKELLESNKEKLLQRNQDLARRLRSTLARLQNGKIMSFHSALAYFADFFDAEQVFVEAEGVELGSDEMLHLFEEARELTFPVLIISPQFEPEKGKALAKQLKLGIVEFDPQYPDVFEALSNLAESLNKMPN